MRQPESADELFRADAKRRGMTDAEYEAAYGIHFTGGPAEQRIRYHELAAGLMTEGDLSMADSLERRRLAHRPRNGRRQRAIRCRPKYPSAPAA